MKSHLESNPTPARDTQGLKQTLTHQDPTETETELYLGVSCGGAGGQQWSAAGTGDLGAADLGVA